MTQHPSRRSSPSLRRRLAGALALVALVAAPAAATPAPPRTDGLTRQELTAAIARWTAGEMHVPPPAHLPHIAFATAERMRDLRYGDLAASVSMDVVAIYDETDGTILLPLGWTGTGPAETSVLVHEMVHYLQAADGRTYACDGASEADAYRLQARWLALYGETLETAFQLNPLGLMVLTRCSQ